jgi:hypothetical protein
MNISLGVVAKLIAGAHVADLDVTSIDQDGKQYYAAMRQCEDDPHLRKTLDIDEFQPVVEIVSRTWHGSYGKFPNIRFLVSDGSQEMTMRVSYRRSEFPVLFFSKNGPFNCGRLNKGKRIKLIDYTCSLAHEKGGTTCPTIFLEKLRAEPRKSKALGG